MTQVIVHNSAGKLFHCFSQWCHFICRSPIRAYHSCICVLFDTLVQLGDLIMIGWFKNSFLLDSNYIHWFSYSKILCVIHNCHYFHEHKKHALYWGRASDATIARVLFLKMEKCWPILSELDLWAIISCSVVLAMVRGGVSERLHFVFLWKWELWTVLVIRSFSAVPMKTLRWTGLVKESCVTSVAV